MPRLVNLPLPALRTEYPGEQLPERGGGIDVQALVAPGVVENRDAHRRGSQRKSRRIGGARAAALVRLKAWSAAAAHPATRGSGRVEVRVEPARAETAIQVKTKGGVVRTLVIEPEKRAGDSKGRPRGVPAAPRPPAAT